MTFRHFTNPVFAVPLRYYRNSHRYVVPGYSSIELFSIRFLRYAISYELSNPLTSVLRLRSVVSVLELHFLSLAVALARVSRASARPRFSDGLETFRK